MTSPPPYAGVDEAGRGPLAGPVAVAAVVLDPERPIAGLGDSKAISAARRERLFDVIRTQALGWHLELVPAHEIDRINILQATFEGMRRCIQAVANLAAGARIDGHQVPPGLCLPATAVVGGDGIDPAIGAASILAKVARDRYMVELDLIHPGYGFARHKGYPTPEHLQALERLGPCPEHRSSFAPVKRSLPLF